MEHEMIMMKFLSSDKTIETNKMEKSCYGLCFCLCFSFSSSFKMDCDNDKCGERKDTLT